MYQIRVHDDGDTEVRRLDQASIFSTDLIVSNLDEVTCELQDYGYEKHQIEDAIQKLLTTSDWVKV